jgi:hypothetical protein
VREKGGGLRRRRIRGEGANVGGIKKGYGRESKGGEGVRKREKERIE